MMRRVKLGWVLGGALLVSAVCAGQERGYWKAASSTAKAITGDVTISGEKIAINFNSFIIAQIRYLQPEEVSSVFDAETGAAGKGSLYRLNVPGGTRFQHKNTLCGSEDTQWMVTYAAGKSLRIAFFSGQKMPVFTPEAIAGSTDLCGTFAYVK